MNITIGQYLPTNSIIHRLDARVKIICMILMIVTIFLVPVSLELGNMILMGGIFLFTILLVLIAKIPIKKVLLGLKAVVFLLTFTFFIQIFTIRTGELLFEQTMHFSISSIISLFVLLVLYTFTKKYIKYKTTYFFIFVFLVFFIQAILPYGPWLSYDFVVFTNGLERAVFIFLRIISVMIIASLLTFTTSPIELNDGLESILSPLKIVRFPVHTVSTMMSLTLRSIPTLLVETEKIMKAQTARGADFKEASLKKKLIQVVALLIPVFVVAINRAEDLSDAMEVRGYIIGQKRTKLDVYQLGLKDLIALLIILALVIGSIIYVFVPL